MHTITHLIVNLIAVIPLKHYLGWDFALTSIFVLAGIAIDIDHIIFFIIKYKTMKPSHWIKIGKRLRSKMQPNLNIFHSPEFNAALLLFGIFNNVALVILLSNITHLTLDAVEHYYYHKNFLWIKKWSIINSL